MCGAPLCNGIWLVIDYFAGAIGNKVYVAVTSHNGTH
jgi:hypothetical protein